MFPWWFLKLYRMPGVFLVFFLIVPLGMLCGWIYLNTEQQWRLQEARDLQVYAELASRTIQEELSRVRELEEAVAAQPALIHAVKRRDRNAVQAQLSLLLRLTPGIGDAVVTLLDGQPLAQVNVSSADRPAVLQLRRPDHPASESTESSTSNVYLYDAESGEKAVMLSTPVRDQHTVLGVLHAQVRLGAISRWLEKIRIEPAGFLYVVDDHGLLVAYPFQLLAGRPKNVSTWPAVARSASGPSTTVRFYQGHPAQPWTAAVDSVTPFSWRVIAQQPDGAMLKPLRQFAGSLAVIIGIFTLIIGVVVLRWAHVHRVTLRLLAQQTRLLQSSEQQRTRTSMRHQQRPEA